VLILAFDTSVADGSVALLDGMNLGGAKMVGEADVPAQQGTARSLTPAIVDLLRLHGVHPTDIRLVAVTQGPGSFTGLRIGVTAAKTFAYAVKGEVIGVSTLAAISHSIPEQSLGQQPREVHAILDAQRRELFVGRFGYQPTGEPNDGLPRLKRLADDQLIGADVWLTSLSLGTVVAGSGLARLADRLPPGVTAATQPLRASVVGQLAWRDYQAGRRDDLWKLAPVYLRPSYAEEKATSRR